MPGPQAAPVPKEAARVRRGEGEADGGAKGRDARAAGKLPGRETKGDDTDGRTDAMRVQKKTFIPGVILF